MANDWLYEDEKYLFENYGKIPTKIIAAKVNKTVGAVRSKYSRMVKEKGDTKTQTATKTKPCPICGKASNTVTSYVDGNVKTVYYCTNCLIEFKGSRLIPPLLNKEVN